MESLEDTLQRLMEEGYDYSYIVGYEKGYGEFFNSSEDLEDFLTDLRNNGEDYEYIKGFRVGFYEGF